MTSPAPTLTDEQIDMLWMTRPNIHDGKLMPQLRDFARAILAANEAAPAAAPAGEFSLVRSIIHDCLALKLPQTFAQRLGMMAQIVPLKGLSTEQAQAIVERLNASPSATAAAAEGWKPWIERWNGSGPYRGWWVWETGHGNPVAYLGDGDDSERQASTLVEKHNGASGELRDLVEVLCSAAVAYGERDTEDAENAYYAAKAHLIGAVRVLAAPASTSVEGVGSEAAMLAKTVPLLLADAQMLLAWMDETFGNDSGDDWMDADAAAVGDALNAAIENFKRMRAALAAPASPSPAGQPIADFCDTHCTWLDHHPDCERAASPAGQSKGVTIYLTRDPITGEVLRGDPPAGQSEPVAKPIMSLAEFCAEGERLGLTAADLAPALAARPEFADCLPVAASPAGVQGDGAKTVPFDREYVHAYLLETLDFAVGNGDPDVQRFMDWLKPSTALPGAEGGETAAARPEYIKFTCVDCTGCPKCGVGAPPTGGAEGGDGKGVGHGA